MTAGQLAQAIGKRGTINVGGAMWVEVVVRNTRVAYGRVDYLVEPVAGKGARWVEVSNVTMTEEDGQ